jgi:chemotaxis protein MotB
MAKDANAPIIVKRKRGGDGGGHHGGAWKIAYADFVTAMMAFFLLMWLLSSSDPPTLKGIAEYFNTPLQVALMGGSKNTESSNIIPGGGSDLSKTEGEEKRNKQEDAATLAARARALQQRQDEARLRELKTKLTEAIKNNPLLSQFKDQLLIDFTNEGLRIQIIDTQNRPMFSSASSDVQPYMRVILREIGKSLNDVPNKVSLSGHTDAVPYLGGERGYSNWELSADRANASRRELIVGGMEEEKVIRVLGLSSSVNLDKENPYNPTNRRISVVVMTKQAEAALHASRASVDIENQTGAASGAIGDLPMARPTQKH